jgi:hypothetical protein
MNLSTYKAPWGKTLCWMSAFSVVVVLAVSVPIFLKIKREPAGWLVALLLPVATLFIVRSYAIEPNVLAIRRLLWTTRLPLAGLQSAEVSPNVMRGSLRLFGNGGMFSFTGLFRNRALGNYRAFVTDLTRTVVLRFPKRTVVVSPENPERFVADISEFAFRTA